MEIVPDEALIPYIEAEEMRIALNSARHDEEFVVIRRDILQTIYDITKDEKKDMYLRSEVYEALGEVGEAVLQAVENGKDFAERGHDGDLEQVAIDHSIVESNKNIEEELIEALGTVSLLSAKATMLDKVLGKEVEDPSQLEDTKEEIKSRESKLKSTEEENEKLKDFLAEAQAKAEEAKKYKTLFGNVGGLDRAIK